MKKIVVFIFLVISINSFCQLSPDELILPKYNVNPFIGTGGHGHTFPGATLPFGMVQLSPDTRLEGWDGCSGYHYSDSIIYGFSHTHLSGTGVSDYGDILFMPTNGNIQFINGSKEGVDNGYASRFSKKSEFAQPGFYSVFLEDYEISVNLTCTERTGIHQYSFNKSGEVYVILDLEHRDQLIEHDINISGKAVSGKRISKSWANEQHIYYYAEFSKAYKSVMFNSDDSTKAAFIFDIKKGECIILKVGISAVDEAGAKNNLITEAPHWDWDRYDLNARKSWDDALSSLGRSGNSNANIIFNTALYHTMIAPNVFSDVDGRYRGMDMKIHRDTTQKTYTVFSLWDTFRAAHPLYTIIEQKRTNEFIHTFLKHYKEGGLLPVWELAANETNCMIGFHSASAIADAYAKGIRSYDVNLALEAMITSSNADDKSFIAPSPEYVNAAINSESVSKTLEYAYDNWCVQLLIDSLANSNTIKTPLRRMFAYRNLFDKDTGFMRPRKNGGWLGNFDPTEVNFHFTEANSWQYSMFVPHNISDLIAMHGGDEAFEKKLDELFSSSSEMGGRHQSDITGLIGQYAHGNEPSHHMAYLYNFIGKPWKTQDMVHRIMSEMYSNAPDGLSGNEDCGQMSAWYVFSAMGFYPVTPGLAYYTIGTPLFNELELNLENGNKFRILANNIGPENYYIQSLTLNGINYPYSYINHSDIMKGGVLIFEMGNTPNKKWAAKPEHRPISTINLNYVSLPIIKAKSETFTDSLLISIKSINEGFDLFYNLEEPGVNNIKTKIKYKKPFYIYEDCTIRASVLDPDSNKSNTEIATFKKIKLDKSIELFSEYANQYAASGNNALIDRLRGSNNFRTGDWQGYQGQDLEAVLSFDEIKEINKISLSCLQDIQSWIWYPKEVLFYTSTDKKKWTLLGSVQNTFPDNNYGAFIQEISLDVKIRTKFIKISALNYGLCPTWHLGAGGKAWIFVDEIVLD